MADIKDVLTKFIEDIESGRKTARDCLREYQERYKGRPEDIESYLAAAEELVKTCRVSPSPKRKQDAKDTLLAAVEKKRWEAGVERVPSRLPSRAERKHVERGSLRPRMLIARLAVITVAFSLISGATLAMAHESLPGNPLYPLKLAVEKARIKMAKGDSAKSKLYLQAAKERISELRKIEQDNKHYSRVAEEAAKDIEQAEAISAKIPPKESKIESKIRPRQPKDNLKNKPVKTQESTTRAVEPEKYENEIRKETLRVKKVFERDFKHAVRATPAQEYNKAPNTTPRKTTPPSVETKGEKEERLQKGRTKSSWNESKVPGSIPGVPDVGEN